MIVIERRSAVNGGGTTESSLRGPGTVQAVLESNQDFETSVVISQGASACGVTSRYTGSPVILSTQIPSKTYPLTLNYK